MIVCAAGHPNQPPPNIKALVQKIVSLVETDGDALIEKTIQTELAKGSTNAKEILEERMRKEKERIEGERIRKESTIAAAKERADILIARYAKSAAGAAALIPLAFDALTDALISGGMFFHIASVYGKKLDLRTAGILATELTAAFMSILLGSGLTLITWMGLSQAARSNPLTYIAGMALDGVFSYFAVSALGNVFSYYCAHDLTLEHKETVKQVMRDYIKENIDKMFLDKLPKSMREEVKKKFNFDNI
jgi:uncharacterized protein (DUF697 family)